MKLLLETTADLDAAPAGTTGQDSAGYAVGKDDEGWFVAHNGKRLPGIADFLPVVLDTPPARATTVTRAELKLAEDHATRLIFVPDEETSSMVHKVAVQLLKALNIPLEDA